MAHTEDGFMRLRELCTEKSWWRVPHLIKLNLLLLVPFVTSYVGGFDGSMLNGIQTVPKWQQDFNHPHGSLLGLMVNMQVIGGVVSLPLAPFAADKYGRRHPIFLGAVIIILGALVQGCAKNFGMFIAGRFFVGLGGGFVATAAPPLLGELAYPTHRPIITAIYNTTWYAGAIVAAWATFGTFRMSSSWSWRIPSLLQALLSIFQVIFIYFVPESPRWLIANGRTAEATKILSIHHCGTEEPTELVRLQVAQITSAVEFERSCESVSYLQFFQTKGNRHRLFIVAILGFIIQWCGNQLISSYLALVLNGVGITDPTTQNLVNGALQIFNFAVACGSATLIDRLGRRFMLLTSTVGMLIAFIVWTALAAQNQQQGSGNKGLGIGVVVMVFVFYAFYNFAMNPLPIAYLLEVLPYTLRAKGLTVFNLAQYCSSLFNGFVNPVALDAIGWKYYIVFICALVLWLIIIYFTFPETRGMTLEEVSEIFDGRQVLERLYDIKAEGLGETEHTEKATPDAKRTEEMKA
ncbi:hexose transporter protein (Lactose permease) [Penicillium canescens]|uniref:Hexose transporter protein (Lactose permease) n=1 Tax=Penicillium canescens TaxID=5083 RepID=A0AAD6I6M2_PENCN|nr:hexose transporter protein (Lactose permease) [Penicillium canescens]KAJ6011680.1 hexose transporter protein (Lactose permease) [Penicillium canescens]KAJ6030929.1 hexose transporter protein (Lactose permease) [Penicillium canescens]KAJ6059351.1 hexose transporter protein (Lactose permease) [Penicillium canescens]KAJ6064667.1 hexose transporter protein (Lactose permease) [Penicillium canescens]KAJ6077069.1 hexose transporter protein (Lactose permease) [Penicillium canescens]